MTDLTAFLAARLDEKRQFAEGLLTHPPHGVSGMRGIAEQMLREAGSDRDILTAYIKAAAGGYRGEGWISLRFAVEALAAAWNDHPDYQQVWKP